MTGRAPSLLPSRCCPARSRAFRRRLRCFSPSSILGARSSPGLPLPAYRRRDTEIHSAELKLSHHWLYTASMITSVDRACTVTNTRRALPAPDDRFWARSLSSACRHVECADARPPILETLQGFYKPPTIYPRGDLERPADCFPVVLAILPARRDRLPHDGVPYSHMQNIPELFVQRNALQRHSHQRVRDRRVGDDVHSHVFPKHSEDIAQLHVAHDERHRSRPRKRVVVVRRLGGLRRGKRRLLPFAGSMPGGVKTEYIPVRRGNALNILQTSVPLIRTLKTTASLRSAYTPCTSGSRTAAPTFRTPDMRFDGKRSNPRIIVIPASKRRAVSCITTDMDPICCTVASMGRSSFSLSIRGRCRFGHGAMNNATAAKKSKNHKTKKPSMVSSS